MTRAASSVGAAWPPDGAARSSTAASNPQGSDGTDARLSNKNLLLSDTAEIDTQPVLVIHADEVTAAHGATVGQLDDNAMFYLRTRGLPEPEARALLTSAFVREPLLSVVEDPAMRELLESRLDRAIDAQALR